MNINFINPTDMAKPRGYSHAVSVSGNRQTIYIGGQNAIDENGNIVGKGDLKKQTEQVLANIEKILRDANGKLENIVKFNIHILQGQNPLDGFRAFQQKWGNRQGFPAITVVFVAGLGNPEWLVEIDAIAEVSG
ncbi:MAG: RidA family protein [Thermodesulfobacteriota bacterium]